MAARKQLTEEQEKVRAEAQTIVKVLGMLEGLSNNALIQIKDACDRRVTPKPDPE